MAYSCQQYTDYNKMAQLKWFRNRQNLEILSVHSHYQIKQQPMFTNAEEQSEDIKRAFSGLKKKYF